MFLRKTSHHSISEDLKVLLGREKRDAHDDLPVLPLDINSNFQTILVADSAPDETNERNIAMKLDRLAYLSFLVCGYVMFAVLLASEAHADQSYDPSYATTYDSNGHVQSNTITIGDTTTTYDANGHLKDTAITIQGSTTHWDPKDGYKGTTISTDPW